MEWWIAGTAILIALGIAKWGADENEYGRRGFFRACLTSAVTTVGGSIYGAYRISTAETEFNTTQLGKAILAATSKGVGNVLVIIDNTDVDTLDPTNVTNGIRDPHNRGGFGMGGSIVIEGPVNQ